MNWGCLNVLSRMVEKPLKNLLNLQRVKGWSFPPCEETMVLTEKFYNLDV